MLKVALIANTAWYLYNFRASLIKFLQEQGYAVVLISPLDEYAAKLQQQGYTWVEWPVDRRFGGIVAELRSVAELKKILRQHNPDIVHIHTMKAILLGSLASLWGRRYTLVNSVAGRGLLYSSTRRVFVLLRQVINVCFRVVDYWVKPLWIFENQADLEYFQKRVVDSGRRSFLIQSIGVDTSRFSPSPETQRVPVVLFLGRFLWSKGLGDLVEAVRAANADGVQVKLRMVGEPDPGNSDSISAQVLSGWETEAFIERVGWAANTPHHYQAANIVALPTRYGEGVPTVLLEAGASGRAVIATDHPGCTAIVTHDDNGLLVPIGDVAALAEAIRELAADAALRARMGQRGRQIVEERFSDQEINRQTLQVYRSR